MLEDKQQNDSAKHIIFFDIFCAIEKVQKRLWKQHQIRSDYLDMHIVPLTFLSYYSN